WSSILTSSSRIRTFFFFQAEDGIRGRNVTGVQTCALPIFPTAEQWESPHLVGRTPCAARLCGAFDWIRGGLCPLELPLRCAAFYFRREFFDTRNGPALLSRPVPYMEEGEEAEIIHPGRETEESPGI